MDYKRYISSLADSSYVELTDSDLTILRRLLRYEMENGPFSVYKIYSDFKNAPKPRAYKVVHQRLQKLYSQGVIEEIHGSYPRGAKFYKISNGGWLNLIMD